MNRLEVLFHAAEALPPGNREAWLRAQCTDDPAIVLRVLDLLRQADDPKLLERSPTMLPNGCAAGDWLGGYRIVRQLGAGGFGIVFEAEQQAPRRRVALKVLRDPFSSPAMQRRFEHESELLGQLDHPGICRIHAAGHDRGKAYFAMELLEGPPLSQFLRQRELSIEQKVRLWLQVVEAIAHAHKRGVLHRDLKPHNVIVTDDGGVPRAKVLDFGIGRRLDADRESMLTATDQMVGTVEYMSPEQFRGSAGAIDVRSDVWALGVIGYEMLAGRLPYDFRDRSLVDCADMVCTTPPRRLLPADGVSNTLAGIVHACLHLEPDRRYQSAIALAQDLQSWLAGDPVRTTGSNTLTQIRWLARRHRYLLRGAAAVVTALVIGTVTSIQYAVAANDERDAATEIARFLTHDLIGASNPAIARGNELTVREALDRARTRLGDQFARRPEVRGEIVHTIGCTYLSLGEWRTAEQLLTEAVSLLTAARGPHDEHTLRSRLKLAECWDQLGDERALPSREALLAECRAQLGIDHPLSLTALDNLAQTLQGKGDLKRGHELAVEALARKTRVLGPDHEDTLTAANNLAAIEANLGNYARAIELDRDTWQTRVRVLGDDHPLTIASEANLGRDLWYDRRSPDYTQRLREARQHTEAALQHRQRVLGPHHPETLQSLNNLMLLQRTQDDLAAAEVTGRELVAQSTIAVGAEHEDTLRARANFSDVLCATTDRSKWEEARQLADDTMRTAEKVFGNDNWVLGWHLACGAMPYHRLGDDRHSCELLERAFVNFRRNLGDTHERTQTIARRLISSATTGGLPVKDEWRALAGTASQQPQPSPPATASSSDPGTPGNPAGSR